MKRKTGIGLNNFWKIQCLSCGADHDLLTDSWKRILCFQCLVNFGFNEVENEILSDSDEEMDRAFNKQKESKHSSMVLRDSSLVRKISGSSGLQEFIDSDGDL